MNSAFRIKESLYLEISQEKNFPVIPAGRIVPAVWHQSFTTFAENQRSFDLHFLRGNSDKIIDNITLGKWRIGGIPPGAEGEHRVEVEIRVGIDGSVGLRATIDEQPLPVTLLTEAFPKIPLTFRVPTIPVEKKIQEQCPECRRNFVIRATNWKGEPFALCLDCGLEFELPEGFQFEETATWEELPPELIKTLGIEAPHPPGGFDTDELKELEELGFDFSLQQEPDLKIDMGKVVRQIPGMITPAKPKKDELSVDDILRMAGKPLSEDQRRNCPNCDAVIARDVQRCAWCGQTV